MKINFTVDCEMEERWIPQFMSMLKEMERLGDVGSSRVVGLFSDGDGDFRPKFNTDVKFEIKEPSHKRIYDAG